MLLARFLLAGSMALMVAWALLLGVVFRDPDLLRGGDSEIDVSMQLSAALVEIDDLRNQVSDLEAEVVRGRIAALQTPALTEADETPVAGAPPAENAGGTEEIEDETPEATPVATAAPTDDLLSGGPVPIDPRPTHRVVQGESLTSIAKLYGTTVEELVAANGLRDPSSIRVGSLLFIP